MTLFSVSLILLFIMDPIGNIASFQLVMEGLDRRRQRIIILREMCIAFGLMAFFYVMGETLLAFFSVSEVTLRVTIGVILFIVGLGILFPGPRSLRPSLKPDPNPILVPLALPLTAGPSLLATIMLYAVLDKTNVVVPMALVIAWIVTTMIHLFGAEIQRACGRNALMGAERLCGMILVMLAIQRFAEGVKLFFAAGHGVQS